MSVSRMGLLSSSVDRNSLINKGLDYLRQYPADELARLLVDGWLYDPGALLKDSFLQYESREPGCTVAYFKAFALLVQHLEQKIDIEFIKKLHGVCMTGVELDDLGGCSPGSFREQKMHVGFTIAFRRMTKEGLMELATWLSEAWNNAVLGRFAFTSLSKSECQDYVDQLWAMRGWFDNLLRNHPNQRILPNQLDIIYFAPSLANIEFKIDEIAASYNDAIIKANTDDEKLTVIIRHIETYERLHPFLDGNGRVFVNLLLNFMLMQNGFPPATFYEPNIFDAYGTANVVQKVKEAMQVTKDIIGGKKDVYGYVLSEEEKKYSCESAQELTKVLKGSVSYTYSM